MKIIHILSGGIDSTTLLYELLATGHDVECLSFNYGQRHLKELCAAEATCRKLNVKHQIIDITSITQFISNSALTGNIDVPHGHYEQDNMKKTVVPSRNTIMLSIANGYAVNVDAETVSIGVHSGDHAIYPDCRPEFIEALKRVFLTNNFKPIDILAPYLFKDKTLIIKEGIRLGVDYSLTWTCYEGKEKACGKCGSCQERLEAFHNNNIYDPLEYDFRRNN